LWQPFVKSCGPIGFEVVVPQGRGSHPAVQQVPVVPVQVWPAKKRPKNEERNFTVIFWLGFSIFFVG